MDTQPKPMNPRRWQAVQDLLSDALELPAHQRAGLLAERCGDDQELRSEVLSLIEAFEMADAYFDDLAGRAGPALSIARGKVAGG
jgi:hypothetical protein